MKKESEKELSRQKNNKEAFRSEEDINRIRQLEGNLKQKEEDLNREINLKNNLAQQVKELRASQDNANKAFLNEKASNEKKLNDLKISYENKMKNYVAKEKEMDQLKANYENQISKLKQDVNKLAKELASANEKVVEKVNVFEKLQFNNNNQLVLNAKQEIKVRLYDNNII